MVKGLSKRVVTIRFSDSHIFEQAIFLVREDHKAKGVGASDVLREACAIAERHTKATPVSAARRGGRRAGTPRWSAPLFIGVGAGVTGLIWLAVSLLF